MFVGNPSRGTGGQMLGLGANGAGQVLDLFGPGAPTAIADGNDINPGVVSAAAGSTYRDITNGNFWFKTSSGWQQISVP